MLAAETAPGVMSSAPSSTVRPRRSLQAPVAKDAWKRFTPETIDYTKCLARMWNKGCGAQCRQVPIPGKTLCKFHVGGQLTHGYVTGTIPFGKFQQFLRAEERSKRRAREHADVEAAMTEDKGKRPREAGEGAPPPKCPRKRRWYTRALMWDTATALDTDERRAERGELRSLADLTDAEYDDCLVKVSESLKANAPSRRRGEKILIKPDVGPRGSADRGGESEAYNGEDGGRVFRWYVRRVYEDELLKMGAGRDTGTEAQCVRALRLTSLRLRLQPQVTSKLREYAGPQCYPQRLKRERWRANEPEKQPGPQEERPLILEQFKDCWMRCDVCHRRRLVKLECLPALTNENFRAGANGERDENWREWLRGAEARYDAFLAQREHAGHGAGAGGDGGTGGRGFGATRGRRCQCRDGFSSHGRGSREYGGWRGHARGGYGRRRRRQWFG